MQYPRTPKDQWLSVKITEQDEKDIRRLYRGGESIAQIAETYEVSFECIRYHVNPEVQKIRNEKNSKYKKKKKTPKEARLRYYHRKVEVLGRRFLDYHNSIS